MASRTLIVCLLMMGVSIAPSLGRADSSAAPPHRSPPIRSGEIQDALSRPDAIARQPVAVIDLTNDQAVRDVANKLLELLASHPDLAPPAVSDGAALVDKLPTDDEIRLADARNKLTSAAKNLIQRSFREAAIDAVEGQEGLLRVTPRLAISLYADLELALGQSRLGEQKEAEAREAFALTYRLDPGRGLDDLHYLPEVIQAYEAAKALPSQTGTIVVKGTGRVWIDGQDAGTAPGEFAAPVGHHVVWLTGPLRETAGKEVIVTATKPGDVEDRGGQLTRPQKVVRFRIALSQAQSPEARAAAMRDLASFVNVHDAVLLSAVNGKIVWQTWRDRDPGFSEVHELRRDRPADVLQPLVPPRPLEPELRVVSGPPVPQRWYARRSVQLGVAATIVVAVIGGYFWTHYHEPDKPWNGDITGFMPQSGGPP